MTNVYLGTRSGVWRVDLASGEVVLLGLEQHRFWAIHAYPNSAGSHTVLAGSYGEGIYASVDSGATWNSASDGLTARALRTIEPDPTNANWILAGTEPARGFRSIDGGRSWSEFTGIQDMDGVEDWFLPYSPRAGAIRNYAATSTGEIYASVEVGGLLHSPNGGSSWSVIQVDPGPRVHDDIHAVIVDPTEDARIFVAMGGALVDRTHGQWLMEPRQIGGVAVSEDAGATWTKLAPEYTRAVMIPTIAPEWLIAGPAARTGAGGWIVGSTDRGRSWQPIGNGIETPMEDMVERFVEAPDGAVWAICSGGRVFAASPGEWRWRNPLPESLDNVVVESVSVVSG